MPDLGFTKMQAVGNDMIIVDADSWPASDWPTVARRLCRWRFGVGSDGLMVVDSPGTGRFRARMFNPDGTGDVCGNGIRCAAVFLHQRGLVLSETFVFDTLWGPLDVRLHTEAGVAIGASVSMGQPKFHPGDLPSGFGGDNVLERSVEIDGRTMVLSSVRAGSTHTALFVDALPDDEPFARWSPKIEHFPAFTEGTSVLWTVMESPHRARVRIWERGGVGESLGCGTGACAIAAIGQRLGLSGDRLTVASPGGELQVTIDPEGKIRLDGPARTVFSGRLSHETAQSLGV